MELMHACLAAIGLTIAVLNLVDAVCWIAKSPSYAIPRGAIILYWGCLLAVGPLAVVTIYLVVRAIKAIP